jgi:ribosomal protein L37AE/L43A
MKNNDTNDPLPEDENLGSAGSPHSTGRTLHQRSTDFEQTEQERSPAHCEVCGASIPPTRDRCPDHQRDDRHNSTSDGNSWSISNVGLVIVAASSKFHALANASVALRRREGGHESDDSFDLIYDFGEPSKTLTSDWGDELPDAAELDSPIGKTLLEEAVSKMASDRKDQEGEIAGMDIDFNILGRPSESEAYVFNERGEAITKKNHLNAFGDKPEDGNHDYWVIPALLYKRSHDISNKTLRDHECVNCGVTQHAFDGLIDPPDKSDRDQIGMWVCLECDSKKAGAPPSGFDDEEVAARTAPPVDDEKPINKAEENEFKALMERLESEDRLDDASESN